MTVTSVRKDPNALTLTLTAEFDASPERVWDLWADPRQLERWWGPPTYPATFTTHDLAPGSRVEYHMTGPSGDQPRGYWDVLEVDPPRRLVFLDGFANDDGTPNDAFPRNEGRVTIEPIDAARTRMWIESHFPSTEAMEQVLAMGMEEGLTQAVGQIDAILARRSHEHDHDDRADHASTLDAPGATITYDIRPAQTDTGAPVLLLIGSPMGASGFGTLAGHFTDRTVVTYDPRGVERSTKADPATESTPEQHADDVHRVIDAHRRGRSGGHLREQRRRGERARARGQAPGPGPHARRARAAAGRDPARQRGRPGSLRGDRPDLPAQRVRGRDGALHRRHRLHRSDDGGVRRPARSGPGHVRHARRG